ncbi:unnamed protein product, partial [marine sediment metagenome]
MGNKESFNFKKLSKFIPFIFTKPLIIAFGVLTFLNYLQFITVRHSGGSIAFNSTFPVNLIIGIGIILDLFFIKNKKVFRNIGYVGMTLAISGFLFILITTLTSYFFNIGGENIVLRTYPGFYFCFITIALIVIEILLNLRINEKPVVKIEKIREKVPKSKEFLKKGLKGVTKKVGEIAGDMAGDLVED